jgi:hypothetical protein
MATYSRWQYSSQFQTYAVGYNLRRDVVIWPPFSLAPNPFAIILEEIRRMWTFNEIRLHPSASEPVTSYHDENHMWTQGCHRRHIYWYRKAHFPQQPGYFSRYEVRAMCSMTAEYWFESPKRPDPFWGPLRLLFNGHRGTFLSGIKRPRVENDHISPSAAEFKTKWSNTSTSLQASLACTGLSISPFRPHFLLRRHYVSSTTDLLCPVPLTCCVQYHRPAVSSATDLLCPVPPTCCGQYHWPAVSSTTDLLWPVPLTCCGQYRWPALASRQHTPPL